MKQAGFSRLIQVQNPTVIAEKIRVERSIISIKSNIMDSIIKNINVL